MTTLFYPPPTRFDSHLFENPLKCAAVGLKASVHGLALGAHTLPGVVPKDAIIVAGLIYVKTLFTSAANTATVALSLVGAGDVKAALIVTSWTAGAKLDVVPVWTAATSVGPLAADTNLVYTVATQALITGEAVVNLWYFLKRDYRYPA
jgi:hypothetical protein